MAYYIGVDCGTQGTKAAVYDPKTRKFIGQGYARHEIIADGNGRREQEPRWWLDALDSAMRLALEGLSSSQRQSIRGIGLSGQQHGLVALDKDMEVLRPAKLWNDTETASCNDQLIQAAGGMDGVVDKIGTGLPVGYTASKLVWMKEHEEKKFSKISYVLNPKDYLNFYLTGVVATDKGSASGTGFYDVIHNQWSSPMIDLIDSSLRGALPPIAGDLEFIGPLRREIAGRYGLDEGCMVALGSGDNMMAAVGAGNVEPGFCTMTLGTSGVLSVFTDRAPIGYDRIIQIQNSIPDGWIPTVCTMNATSTTTAIQNLLSLAVDAFDDAMAKAPIGAEGIVMLPFFNGERMPALPGARGSIHGITIANLTQPNLIRSSAEAVTMGLLWGGNLLRRKGVRFDTMRLVGGGSGSAPWRQMIADAFDVEVVGVAGREAGVLGGVIEAMASSGEGSIQELCKENVVLDRTKMALPVRENVVKYQELYEKYLSARLLAYGL